MSPCIVPSAPAEIIGGSQEKPNRRADGTCYPSVVWSSHRGRQRRTNVFVSYRGRVTKVAPECLRKASVAEQMSWDITT